MWLSLRDPALIRDTWVRSVVTPSYVIMWAGTPWDTCSNDSRHQERRVMQQWYQTMMLVMRVMRSLHVITIMWDSGLYGATGSHQTSGTMCPPGIFQAPNWLQITVSSFIHFCQHWQSGFQIKTIAESSAEIVNAVWVKKSRYLSASMIFLLTN